MGKPTTILFWSHVLKADGCWEWQGARNRAGRGTFNDGNKTVLAPRYSWELHYGLIPDGMNVCHKCDNPGCVRPDHLFLGTQLDNMRDSIAKGRFMTVKRLEAVPRGETHYLFSHPEKVGRGEQKSNKLTDQQVYAIRRLRQSGLTLLEISRQFGVCFQTVSLIVNRKTWTHLPDPD